MESISRSYTVIAAPFHRWTKLWRKVVVRRRRKKNQTVKFFIESYGRNGKNKRCENEKKNYCYRTLKINQIEFSIIINCYWWKTRKLTFLLIPFSSWYIIWLTFYFLSTIRTPRALDELGWLRGKGCVASAVGLPVYGHWAMQ